MPDAPAIQRSRVMVRTVVAIVLGALLFWQIGAAGFAGLAVRSLDTRLLATTGTPAHPQAASLLAQALLAGGDHAGAARLARSVVLVDPTNDRAVRVLGLAVQQGGQRDHGAAIMREAAALGWRDTPTQLWALQDAALRDDSVTVIQRADALARRNRSGELTRAIFLAAVTEPSLRAAFIDSLSKKPEWRAFFFADVRQRLPESSIDGMDALFSEMRTRHQAIMPIEWLSYVDRLIDLGQFQRARNTWAGTFGIPSVRFTEVPYDGNFTLVAGRPADALASQFEWIINPDLAGAVTFAGGPQASWLSIPAGIVGGEPIVSQIIILPSGPHDLVTQVQGTASTAAAGWSIICLPSKLELPRRLPHGANDELSLVSFTVPADGCGAQRLTLVSRDLLDAQSVAIGKVRIR